MKSPIHLSAHESKLPRSMSAISIEHETVNAHTRLAYHLLIAQIWVNALKLGFDGNASSGKRGGQQTGSQRHMWVMWDSNVPIPTEETMPLWMLACESNLPVDTTESTYHFIPPVSQHLLFANLMDPGYDFYLRAPIRSPLRSHPKAYANTGDRAKLRKLNLLRSAPAFLAQGNKVVLQPRLPIRATTNRDDNHTYDRLMLLHGISSIPKDPMCALRVYKGAGYHISSWTRYGLSICNPVERIDWITNDRKIHICSTESLTTVPLLTPPVWFGFTDSYPDGPLYAWAKEYARLRPIAIKNIKRLVDTQAVIESAMTPLRNELERAGRIIGANGEASNKKRSNNAKREQLMADFDSLFDN